MPTNNANRHLRKFIDNHFYDTDYRNAFTDDGYTRLKAYLGKAKLGQPKVFTAPFAKGDSMSKILQDWDNVLVSISERWPTLYEFEMDLAKKVGPLSVQLPLQDRLADIAHYYEDISLPQVPIDGAAIKAVISEFSSLRGLHLRSQEETWANMKKSTSAGAPTLGKRRVYLPDQIPCRTHTYEGRHPDVTLWYSKKFKNREYYDVPAIVGWRGQEGGPTEEDVKQRVIWMFPSGINLCELQVYQPLIEGAQKHNLVSPWVSMDAVDDRITKLFDTKRADDLVICTDFSKFDQHFNRVMREAAKSILQAILRTNVTSQGWLEEVFPAKYFIPLCWDYCEHENQKLGIKTSDITCFEGEHGMASGSGGTNADETLAHRALQYEVALKNGERLNVNSMCLGDDGILTYPGITVEEVVQAYSSHGQECNTDKQYASTQDCVFLRRWHHKDYRMNGKCVGVYSTCRALGKLRYLERFMDPEYWTREMVAMRQLSIIENCNWHPLFEEFVEFCMERDSYRLGLDIPGFLDNITELAKEATDHINDFLGYTKTLQGEGPSGISEWRVVKYLKSKA
nr:RNA-dependent RNA polymerase [Marmot picobirnavirus]